MKKYFDTGNWLAESRKKGKRVAYYRHREPDSYFTYSGWAIYIDTVKIGPFSAAIVLVPQCDGDYGITIKEKYYEELPYGFRIAGGQQLTLIDSNHPNWEEIDCLLRELLPTAQTIWSLFLEIGQYQDDYSLLELEEYTRSLQNLGREVEAKVFNDQLEKLSLLNEQIEQPFLEWRSKVLQSGQQLDLVKLRPTQEDIDEFTNSLTIKKRQQLDIVEAYQEQEKWFQDLNK